jgi:hypothetical protein
LSQWPRTILVSTNQGGRGHGAAGLPASQLPFIQYASHRQGWAAVTLDVSASRYVGEGGSRRERKSGAENNRSGKHEFSRLEHCCSLSDQSVVFPLRATSKHSGSITTLEQIVRLIDYSHWASLRANSSIKLL